MNTENSVRSENTGVPTIREIIVATTMSSLLVAFFALIASTFRTRAALQAEILALRHQLAVLQKNGPRRLRLHRCDRLLWVLLYRFWSGWRRCLAMVQPDTVIRWHRKAFAWHWTRKSRRLPGRPEVAANIRDLIRRMSQANPLWGAPRIHGELLKLGIAVAQSTVARYLPRPRKPPSQGRKSLRLCLSGVMRIRWFDPIAEASELPDHFASAPLLRLFGDRWASLFVTNSLVQEQPDQATLSMGNGPDGLLMSQTRDRAAIDNFEDTPFGLYGGVRSLIEYASHVAVALGDRWL